MTPRLLPYGPGGWLVELAEHEVIGYAAAARAIAHPGVAEVVPGARTVLVRVAEPAALDEVGAILAVLAPQPVAEAAARLVEIPVTYDGEDLDAVASATGLSTREVADRHATSTSRAPSVASPPGSRTSSGSTPPSTYPGGRRRARGCRRDRSPSPPSTPPCTHRRPRAAGT